MSDPLEDRLREAGEAVRELEKELDKFNSDNAIRQAVGTLTPARALEGQQLQNRLYEARQRQTSLLLESLNTSSNRLESATTNLQRTSEAQVKVAESQVRVSESQALVMRDLLRSSHRLEQFALFLIVLTALSIFIVEQSIAPTDPTLRTIWLVLGIVSILALMILAYRWPLVRKGKLKSD